MQVENISEHINLLCLSFKKWTGKSLFESNNIIHDLYHAPFALVSHGTEADPIFNYANLKAQELWELDLENFTQLPSRLSAEPILQEVRDTFMKQVTDNGFVSDYDGIRISSTGKRFIIKNTTVWNVIDENGKYHGQAAMFPEWEFL
jgi:hypothetical protein